MAKPPKYDIRVNKELLCHHMLATAAPHVEFDLVVGQDTEGRHSVCISVYRKDGTQILVEEPYTDDFPTKELVAKIMLLGG